MAEAAEQPRRTPGFTLAARGSVGVPSSTLYPRTRWRQRHPPPPGPVGCFRCLLHPQPPTHPTTTATRRGWNHPSGGRAARAGGWRRGGCCCPFPDASSKTLYNAACCAVLRGGRSEIALEGLACFFLGSEVTGRSRAGSREIRAADYPYEHFLETREAPPAYFRRV